MSQLNQIRGCLFWCTLLGVSFIFCGAGQARTRVDIGIGGISSSSCETAGEKILITGSLALITVTVLPDPKPEKLPFAGFSETKPNWLDLEFGFMEGNKGVFDPTLDLHALLNPQYFLSETQLLYQEAWKEGDDLKEIAKKPIHYFLIQIPEGLMGATICARAILSPPPFGDLVQNGYGEPLLATVARSKIVAPCSKEDSAQVVESRIKFTRYSGQFERAVALADSFVNLGWRVGLMDALTSARRTINYVAALRFLELLYETKGTVVPNPSGALNSAGEEERAYRERREELLRLIAEQEVEQR